MTLSEVVHRTDTGKACEYLLRHWESLTRHVDLGESRLNNNPVENAIRPSAIGKMN